jgi:hypothetical protein
MESTDLQNENYDTVTILEVYSNYQSQIHSYSTT